ncbi:DUF2306 domain-containing protein [Henriciella aquimarina]|uniref:DUF2306 domain-containing protein n=1 Tax=Henriciella aquimarina TaxID=545261 RepID=UPI0009FCAD6F|nr:DUF2306 domain-containing protein [Henriciella aquimarina]
MSPTDVSSRARLLIRRPKLSRTAWTLLIALPIYAGISALSLIEIGRLPRFRFDPTPLIESGIAIQIHVAAALTTLAIGIYLMVAPKGFRLHRTFGWAWVVSMAVTAGSSFFISTLFQTSLGPIHALSAWTMLGLPMGIAAIKRRDVARHRKDMTNMFVGGMVIAGLFSLLPGRLMWHVFFAL